MLEPSAVVLYVENLSKSREFYQELLGIKPEKLSVGFNQFTLCNGMRLGLKDRATVQPSVTMKNGSGELAFSLENGDKINELFAYFQKKAVSIAQEPISLTFGYTFVVLDPDGNRLRFVTREEQ